MSFDEIPNRVKPAMLKDNLEIHAMHCALVSQHQEIESLKRKLKNERAKGRSLKLQLDFSEQCNSFRGAIAFPVGMLDRLIRLCHPDKDGGSDASTEATAWLLRQRK